jgi:hypothetical protein
MATVRRRGGLGGGGRHTANRARQALFGVAVLTALPGNVLRATEPARPTKNATDLAGYDAAIKPEDRAHWAFQPIKRPAVPSVKDAAWVRNPIDRFILAKLEEKRLPPPPAAEPAALLRRLFLDVTGLPPTILEQEALSRELRPAPGGLEHLIDALLARPAYGERWGRHWLDLVRYAESNGYERDAAKPFAWRYRDYVIRAFNADKPFDRFVLEQLAGDELPEQEITAETLVATGYYRLGPWDDEPADAKQERYDQLDDIVSTTSEVFLGLTIGCARCHNHKFEPLSMHDYYRMVAIFEPLQRPVNGRTELTLPIGTPPQIAAKAAKLPQGYILTESSGKPPVSHLLLRGQAATPGPEVGPGFPAVMVKLQPVFPRAAPGARTSQRRLTLARWLTSAENALFGRTIVNRVWQYHFGVGLVRTPSDFGTMGEPPTHPELLDWLASWFVEHGFSIKALHRLILSSSTYGISSRGNSRFTALDPDNQLFWRMPYQRLEVEVIRDAMLAASGKLNRQMYGPSMYPFISRAALAGHSDPNTIWKASDESASCRRTIYAFVKRSLIVPILEVLDFCDTTRSSATRSVTSVPTQALTLLNGDFVNRQAEHLADRLERDAGAEPAAQVDRALSLALCRKPRESERAAMLAFLARESKARRADAVRARTTIAEAEARHQSLVQLCRAIFNLNEFVYAD